MTGHAVEAGPGQRAGPVWTLALTSVAVAMISADLIITTVAVPVIGAAFHASLTGLEWLTNGYSLTFASLLLPAGALSDRLGRRRVFCSGVVLFTSASALCTVSPSALWLVCSRVLQGAGGALVLSSALALITVAHPEGAPRRRALTVYASVSALAVAVAPLLGGAIAQGFGWRWIFGINVPVGAVVIALNRKLPHVERGSGARPDVAGAALATAALFAMNIVLLRGPEVGWGSPFTLSVAVICAAAVTALVAYLYGEPERLLDLRMLRSRGFSGAALIGILARFFGLGPIVFISLDLEGVMGYTPLQAGLRLLAMPVPLLIFSPVGGWLKERWGAGQTMALGLAVSAIGLAWSSAAAATADWTALLPALVLCGAGGGLYTPVLIGVALTAVPPSRAGQASGMLNACFPLGTALGVAVLGLVLRVTVNERLPRAPALLRGAAQSGDVSRVAADGASVARAARSAFTSGLSAVLLSAACVAALATVIAVVAIRRPGGHGVPSP